MILSTCILEILLSTDFHASAYACQAFSSYELIMQVFIISYLVLPNMGKNLAFRQDKTLNNEIKVQKKGQSGCAQRY